MFSEKVISSMKGSSFIRAMFEEGAKLKNQYGADRVFDFSIGNPEIEPPREVTKALKKLVDDETPGMHMYMSNAGYPDVREKIAKSLSTETGLDITGGHIIMTCGAAAALNIVLKSLLNPGEEVVVFSPYFVEYLFYVENNSGKPVIVPVDKTTFMPDANELEKHITPRTKAVIINSPNNPTGVIYSENTLEEISRVLIKKEKEYGTSIFIVSDDPYTKIVYDNAHVPSILQVHKNSISVTSYSKSLALPGERIGYIAVNPDMKNNSLLVDALVLCNRILGFVNAPALFQRTVGECINASVDMKEYRIRRDMIYNHLDSLGYSCVKPSGAFYLFPKSLIEDDVAFCKAALKYNILIVPGSGFGWPGHFRLAFCVNLKTIENSLPAFEALTRGFKH
jgi:aspartate aminotransferase